MLFRSFRLFLVKDVGYDPVKDFTPIARAIDTTLCIAAGPSAPFTSLAGMIDYAKKNPGRLNVGGPAVGGMMNLTVLETAKNAGIDVRVSSRSGAAINTMSDTAVECSSREPLVWSETDIRLRGVVRVERRHGVVEHARHGGGNERAAAHGRRARPPVHSPGLGRRGRRRRGERPSRQNDLRERHEERERQKRHARAAKQVGRHPAELQRRDRSLLPRCQRVAHSRRPSANRAPVLDHRPQIGRAHV